MALTFKPREFVGRRIVILTILLAVFAVLAQLAEVYWAFELLTHFTWHYVLAGIVFAILLLWSRRRRWAIVAIIIAVVHIPFIPGYEGLQRTVAGNIGVQEELRILQFNIGSRNTRTEEFYTWLASQEQQPDIVILIEATTRLEPVINRMKNSDWPNVLAEYHEDNFGIAVLSSIDDSVSSVEEVGDPFLPSIAIRGFTRQYSIPFSILATHPPPPVTSSLAEARNRQLEACSQWVSNEAAANRIIAGDLNITVWSPVYNELLQGSGMSNAQAGFGFGGTFPSWLPPIFGIPIDHTLVTPNIAVLDRETGPGLGSDHRPVTTTLLLRR